MQAFCHPQNPAVVVLTAHHSPMLHDILMTYVRRGELAFDHERRWFEVPAYSYQSLKAALLRTEAGGTPAPLATRPAPPPADNPQPTRGEAHHSRSVSTQTATDDKGRSVSVQTDQGGGEVLATPPSMLDDGPQYHPPPMPIGIAIAPPPPPSLPQEKPEPEPPTPIPPAAVESVQPQPLVPTPAPVAMQQPIDMHSLRSGYSNVHDV